MAAVVALIAGCGGDDASTGGEGSGAENKKIAISFPNYSKSDALQGMLAVTEAEAKKLGYELTIDDPGADLNRQISTLRTWISQKVPAIVAVAPNPPAFEGVAKAALDGGTTWVTYAGRLENQTATLGFDNVQGGEELGTAAANWINDNLAGKAKIALFTFQSGGWARERASGVESKLKELAPDASIVAKTDAYSRSEGVTAARTVLQAHPDLNVVLCIEENACLGAHRAIAAEKGKDNPDVFIGGINGEVAALELLRDPNGIYRATSALDLTAIGKAFVTLPAKLLEGGKGDHLFDYTLLTQGTPEVEDAIASAPGN